MRPGALDQRVKEQAEVLDRAAALVKSGGRIAYVTCSVLAEEKAGPGRGIPRAPRGFSVARARAPSNRRWARAPLCSERRSLPSDDGLLMTPRRTDTDGFFVQQSCGARRDRSTRVRPAIPSQPRHRT